MLLALKSLFSARLILVALVAALAAGATGYWRGYVNTKNSITADVLREEQLAQRLFQEMLTATAGEIAKIEINNKTIRQEVEREIRYEPVYRDCVHSPDTQRLLDAILTGQAPAESLGVDELPGTDPARRQ